VCYWNQPRYRVTIPLEPGSTNVGTIHTASGVDRAISAVDSIWQSTQDYAMDSLVLLPEIVPELYPPDSDDHGIPIETTQDNRPHITPNDDDDQRTNDKHRDIPISEGADTPPNEDSTSSRPTHLLVLPTERETQSLKEKVHKSDENEIKNRRLLQWWHKRLGHISMHTIQHTASKGLFPMAIAKCQVPVCQACLFGMMTKRPWRTKAVPRPLSIVITVPGYCVSVDQLESRTPGLLGQLKGTPTTARFRVSTVFVDHIGDFTYVHLQQTTNVSETLKAKRQFESHLQSHGITTRHYHADNGRFIESAWVNDTRDKGQDMSYSGVGAHHQNGTA
jgi:GAG-pre-integrase domain